MMSVACSIGSVVSDDVPIDDRGMNDRRMVPAIQWEGWNAPTATGAWKWAPTTISAACVNVRAVEPCRAGLPEQPAPSRGKAESPARRQPARRSAVLYRDAVFLRRGKQVEVVGHDIQPDPESRAVGTGPTSSSAGSSRPGAARPSRGPVRAEAWRGSEPHSPAWGDPDGKRSELRVGSRPLSCERCWSDSLGPRSSSL
jgi:hypothetical protein